MLLQHPRTLISNLTKYFHQFVFIHLLNSVAWLLSFGFVAFKLKFVGNNNSFVLFMRHVVNKRFLNNSN